MAAAANSIATVSVGREPPSRGWPGPDVPAGSWSLVAMTLGPKLALYLNGANVGEADAASPDAALAMSSES